MNIDKERIQEIIEIFSPGADLMNFKRLEGGVSSDVFQIEIELEKTLKKLVLRSEGGPPAENTIKTEFELLKILQETEIPCAEPLFLDTSRKILDKKFMLMSHLEGSIDIPDRKNLSSIKEIARNLRSIHETNTSFLPNLPLRIDPLEDLFDYLPHGKNGDKLKKFLSTKNNTEYKGTRVFLHGDYWPGNILWKQKKITGIVDWEYAAIGDPFSDLAVTSLELRYEYGVKGMEELLEIYSSFLPIDRLRYSLWLIFVASSTLYFIHEWKLTKDRESSMKKEAMATIEEESYFLLNS